MNRRRVDFPVAHVERPEHAIRNEMFVGLAAPDFK
jgi:hypothetical protein